MKDTKKLGKVINSLRLRNDMSLRDLSLKSGVSYSFISSIEHNRFNGSRDTITALASAMPGADLNQLLLLAGLAPVPEDSLVNDLVVREEKVNYDTLDPKIKFILELELDLGIDLNDPEKRSAIKRAAKIYFANED